MNSPQFQIFCDYMDELQAIKGLPPLNSDKQSRLYRAYRSEESAEWLYIRDPEGSGSDIGFLVIGYPPNCHPDADYYIEEAYIKPEFRRKKLMSETVSHFIRSHPGRYCLFILKGNEPARHFWHQIFTKHGYIPYPLRDVGAGDEYCVQYGFRKP